MPRSLELGPVQNWVRYYFPESHVWPRRFRGQDGADTFGEIGNKLVTWNQFS